LTPRRMAYPATTTDMKNTLNQPRLRSLSEYLAAAIVTRKART